MVRTASALFLITVSLSVVAPSLAHSAPEHSEGTHSTKSVETSSDSTHTTRSLVPVTREFVGSEQGLSLREPEDSALEARSHKKKKHHHHHHHHHHSLKHKLKKLKLKKLKLKLKKLKLKKLKLKKLKLKKLKLKAKLHKLKHRLKHHRKAKHGHHTREVDEGGLVERSAWASLEDLE